MPAARSEAEASVPVRGNPMLDILVEAGRKLVDEGDCVYITAKGDVDVSRERAEKAGILAELCLVGKEEIPDDEALELIPNLARAKEAFESVTGWDRGPRVHAYRKRVEVYVDGEFVGEADLLYGYVVGEGRLSGYKYRFSPRQVAAEAHRLRERVARRNPDIAPCMEVEVDAGRKRVYGYVRCRLAAPSPELASMLAPAVARLPRERPKPKVSLSTETIKEYDWVRDETREVEVLVVRGETYKAKEEIKQALRKHCKSYYFDRSLGWVGKDCSSLNDVACELEALGLDVSPPCERPSPLEAESVPRRLLEVG